MATVKLHQRINSHRLHLNELLKFELKIRKAGDLKIADSKLQEMKVVLYKHKKILADLLWSIAKSPFPKIRLMLLDTPYLTQEMLKTIIHRTRRPKELSELIQAILQCQLFSPDILKLVLSKHPDPRSLKSIVKLLGSNDKMSDLCHQYVTSSPSVVNNGGRDFLSSRTGIRSVALG